MERKFCQSCGMPFEEKPDPEIFGTEADGSRNEDYCAHCYQKGQFTFNGSMEDMINMCVPYVVAAHKELSEEAAREMMHGFLPNLKRWSNPDQKNDLEAKATALLDQCFTLALSSITAEGYPRPCVLVKIAHDGIKKIYVSTGTSSQKTDHFRKNPKAGLCFSDNKNGVTLIGTVRILADKTERSQYWQDWMFPHFPKGTEDPEFCVLEFTTNQATYWIDNIFATYQYD